MGKKKVYDDSAPVEYGTGAYSGTVPSQSLSSMPLADEERELIRFINSVEMTYSGIELLYMKPRLVRYLRLLQEKGL